MKKVKTGDIFPWPGNPRRGDVAGIAESIRLRGQFRPLLVQKSSNQIIAGNQTYEALTKKLKRKTCLVIFLDVSDDMAKEILVADNRFGELGFNDAGDLYKMLKSMENPSAGTGYEPEDIWKVYQGFEERDADVLEALKRPSMVMAPIDLDAGDVELDEDFSAGMDRAKSRAVEITGIGDAETVSTITNDDVDSNSLKRRLESHGGIEWPSLNYWGIPDLREDMLVQSLPSDLTKFDTWAGGEVNTDDGDPDRWWFYGWGAGSRTGLPWDRTILHFFTKDTRFDNFITNSALYISKVVEAGCTQAVTLDVSYYNEDSRYRHMEAIYTTNWVGRLMQEAGMKIIPRIQWSDIESMNYAFLGIPENAPVLAMQMQTVTEEEAHNAAYQETFRLLFKKFNPKQMIVYTGPPGRRIVESLEIPKSVEIVYLENYVSKRRGVIFDTDMANQKLG